MRFSNTILWYCYLYGGGLINTCDGVNVGQQILDGLHVGQQIIDSLAEKNISKLMTSLSSGIGDFFGAISPLIELLLKDKGDSPELVLMKKEFENINRRLDIFSHDFQQVNRLIDWRIMQVSYATEEKKIKALKAEFNDIFAKRYSNLRANKIDHFMKKYESDFQNSGLKIFQGIEQNCGVFSSNLLEASVKFTQGDRKKVYAFSMGLVQLLISSCEIQVAYFHFRNFDENIVDTQRLWTDRMVIVCEKLRLTDLAIVGNWNKYANTDIDQFSAINYELSNSEFNSKLYTFLAVKYYWRVWFVLTTRPVDNGEKFFFSACGRDPYNHLRGRNVVVQSVDSKMSTFNRKTGNDNLLMLEHKVHLRNAEYLYNKYRRIFDVTLCEPVALIGFVYPDIDVVINSALNRTSFRSLDLDGGEINGYLFG